MTVNEGDITEQEIWFERWLWSYLPIHWKGWAFVFAAVVAAGGIIPLSNWIAALAGHPGFGDLGFLVVPAVIFDFDPLMRRHSRKFI
jgi:hypothetical protein